ncbi:PREDICTED: 15-hydroxyprostaglandin dehydrogenase [NAD(+)]-like [Vollenhovia emeryi]|uniref:15-hydroxyprostaglandin dehydrogenase [NAD(+)]-like n=1 Tax=Vollenhovia emeryi TaxID=411798 RepID=UPI0005F39A64|nr:PREDICTED: 15-hydroxyprostaglandin dehydrogenase [NAD(+)]-like [Vollenhovia emeryi]
MDNVENKTAIVTGAGSGIGYNITEELLRKGAKTVAILDLPVARSYDASKALQEKFGKDRVIFFPIDITNLEVYSETFKQVVKALNGLDILVNNAGICQDPHVEKTFDVNVIALIRGSLFGLNFMGKHKGGKGGTIVNIASAAGLIPFAVCPIYSSSKYAVVGFGANLEKFYDKTGVRILTICPSFTATAITVDKDNCLDIIDNDIIQKNTNESFHKPQTAAHVGQSTVMTIQKGKNGSIWIIKNNEQPYEVKSQYYAAV